MIRVTCAIIRNEDNDVLVVQRGEKTDHPFKWEFPGGKVAEGESDEESVIREIMEELSMEVVICKKLDEVCHDYGHKKKIELIPYVCDTLNELPVLSEHIDFKWIAPEDLDTVDFCEADRPVAGNYMELEQIKTVTSVTEEETELSEATDTDLQKMINNLMSMQEAEWIAASAGENPVLFKKLLDFSYSSDTRLAFRASWTLSKVCDKYPLLINPYIEKIVDTINGIENESTRRSFLRILSMTDLNLLSQKHQGKLADHCFKALSSGLSAIAIKAYSMEILYKLALIYPELANELAASINMLQGECSAGIVARGRIILKKIAEITSDGESGHTIA